MITAREVLNFIDQQLLELPTAEREKLWDVLTALRGPDAITGPVTRISKSLPKEPIARVKSAWTAVIRLKAFPRSAAHLKALVNDDDALLIEVRKLSKTPSRGWRSRFFSNNSHFLNHCEKAFDALDLKKRELNQ